MGGDRAAYGHNPWQTYALYGSHRNQIHNWLRRTTRENSVDTRSIRAPVPERPRRCTTYPGIPVLYITTVRTSR